MLIDHDVPPGPLMKCQVTGSENLNLVIDMGHQPPCNALLTEAMLHEPETCYPLRVFHCPDSGLVQLDYVVDGSVVYPASYPYRSGISAPLAVYQRALADDIVARFAPATGSLCVDVGSNDGTLLTGLRDHKLRPLGVEPTDVAQIARTENGIETIQSFFTEAVAADIVRDYGQARIVTMTNVFAHMARLGEVMRGLLKLVHNDGVFISESHYLLDILEKTQFDTFYHEHIRSYTVKSLTILFGYYGMEVFDAQRGSRYAGNIRVYVGRKGRHPVSRTVGELLALEEASGMADPATWRKFRDRVHEQRDRFMTFLYEARRQGRSIAGNSCPGRASTLLNFYGVNRDQMPYIGELPKSLKLGKYLPGKHIPIVDNRKIVDEQPDYLVLLAWHFTDAIARRVRSEGVTAQLVVPLPEFAILEQ